MIKADISGRGVWSWLLSQRVKQLFLTSPDHPALSPNHPPSTTSEIYLDQQKQKREINKIKVCVCVGL
jgi:hypothetical protein